MPTVSGTILVNKPASEVFNFLANTANRPRFSPAVVSSNPQQMLSKGAKGIEVRKMGGRTITSNYEVMEFEAPRRYVAHFTAKGMDATTTTECKEVAGGTQVTVKVQLKSKGLMMWLMMPMITPQTRKGMNEALQNTKKLLGG